MQQIRRILFVAPAALLLAACATEPNAMQRVSVSTAIGSLGAHTASAGISADLIITGTGGSVKITSAQVTLSRIKLATDSACTSADDQHEVDDSAEVADSEPSEPSEPNDDNGESDCAVVRTGPVTVDLPLDGSTKVILDGLVPAGTYTGVRAKLEGVNVVGVFTDAGGTDHPFTFTSEVEAEIAVDFASPITVSSATTNLTVDVDVGTWFKDASGAILDPTNAANQEAIEHAVRASFRAFEDDDHDGADDHEQGDH